MKTSISVIATILACLGLAACGGSSSGSTSTPLPTTNASPGGIWEGEIFFDSTRTSVEVVGVVTESGEFRFITSDGQQIWGNGSITNVNQLALNFTWVLPLGFTTAGGATEGTGSLTGTVAEQSRIQAAFTSTSSVGELDSGTIDVFYDNLYERASSLDLLVGDWSAVTEILSIDASGAVFSQDPTTGCVLNGQFSIIDARYDVYRASLSFDNCATPETLILNGFTMTGLAVVADTTVANDTLIAAVSGSLLGVMVGITGEFLRQ